MTGFGEARIQAQDLSISIELKSVNNRFLKVIIKSSEAYQRLDTEIDRMLRETLKRGTIQVQIQVHRKPRPDDYQINVTALRTYHEQLRQLSTDEGLPSDITLATLLTLPGVAEEEPMRSYEEDHWDRIEPILKDALKRLQIMRAEEGTKMAQELQSLNAFLHDRLKLIQAHAPEVAREYHKRLHEKLQNVLSEYAISLDAGTLVREVAIFADRSDIHEEITRLGSHLEQFNVFLNEAESTGRKLDFLIQEMNREVNTIGSKGNDILITRHVVEMKGAIEKMRELIQNVE
ncbi:MAG: YicC family protein [Planctomycetia bacterium]|nr:YicC family protein [Planctomycetia bacterium]